MLDMNGPAKDFIADLIDIINAKVKAGEEPEINLVFFGGVFVFRFDEPATEKEMAKARSDT